jgi:VCBS repeat protein
MRTLRIVVLAAGLLVVGAMPVGAATVPQYWVQFSISPVGGTPGTNINVTGQCGGVTEGDAYLKFPLRSDAIPPPGDHKHFTVSNNNFSTTLQNPYGSDAGYPTDAEVQVYCGTASAVKAFQGSSIPMGVTPSIFASLGATPCGFAYLADPAADARIPCPTHVKGFNAAGALSTTNFYPQYDDTHGASIAIGDANNDGQVDIVTGGGSGSPGAIRLNKLDGTLESVTAAYGDFAGGFTVAVGDVTGDGKNDVVTGAGPGGGPHVIVWSYNQTQNTFDPVSGFYAYDPRFSGGVNVAVGQFDSRFTPEIVTGPGPGGGPDVRRFSADGTIRASFYAYDSRFGGGVSVATFPDANGLGKIVTGAGPGGGPHVKVFPGNGVYTIAGWYAYDPAFTGGVSVAAGTVDGAYQIVTGAGPGGGPHIRVFNLDGFLHNGGWYAFGQCCGAGVRVAVTP